MSKPYIPTSPALLNTTTMTNQTLASSTLDISIKINKKYTLETFFQECTSHPILAYEDRLYDRKYEDQEMNIQWITNFKAVAQSIYSDFCKSDSIEIIKKPQTSQIEILIGPDDKVASYRFKNLSEKQEKYITEYIRKKLIPNAGKKDKCPERPESPTF